MWVAASGRTRKASARASIATPGGGCWMGAGSIPAAARAKTWQRPCRPRTTTKESIPEPAGPPRRRSGAVAPAGANWRFRVREGEVIEFQDEHRMERFVAGQDFGDFLVWRRDDLPSYQLAVVVDDAAMQVTEVVRGADLLKSTARQILLERALGLSSPAWYHCDLLRDERGQRLAKRHNGPLEPAHVAGTGTTTGAAGISVPHKGVIFQDPSMYHDVRQ